MPRIFRIHGDNIVECERLLHIITNETQPHRCEASLISPSTIRVDLGFFYAGSEHNWKIELLPGFNKAGRSRWKGNIFTALRENGSFLDETPDAIVTSVDGDQETILFAIEFCSALQAGNQAWQRSGRAFSTGRTGCPYLYIVDFVKYELDSSTRVRKALRFPNPAVPYSYINFSKDSDSFVAQIYVRSEEFDKASNRQLRHFNENDFADKEMAVYMVKKMAGLDTAAEEAEILRKNLNVVLFLAEDSNGQKNFTQEQWRRLYACQQGIIQFSVENARFNFHKTITGKGHHGRSSQVLDLVDGCSVGLASKDLPFGIIPANQRQAFAHRMQVLYPSYQHYVIEKIGNPSKDLILCILKGFKPRGDDNRPDRGLLPLATMLSSCDAEIMTYIYGPVLYNNYQLLLNAPKRLADANGLWKSILALSDYVALDVPILRGPINDAELLVDTSALKKAFTVMSGNASGLKRPVFSSVPQSYHEDDVDTGIHYLFAHVLKKYCFEGMCNPPGGDWSGFSVLDTGIEKRWLSLPRVSDDVDGKRPDHIIELFGVLDKPLLLSIESKEKSIDLEPHVGLRLVNYLKRLMDFVPNVERTVNPSIGPWRKSRSFVSFHGFEVLSAAAYLKTAAQHHTTVFHNSSCELLFVMEPAYQGWKIEVVANSEKAHITKQFLINAARTSGDKGIVLV